MTGTLRVILEVGKKRTAHHVMDHAWEMEDRDQPGTEATPTTSS